MNPSVTKQKSVIDQIPEGSLFQFLEESAVTYRNRIAVIDEGKEFTYDALYKQTLHLSSLLASKGVKQGDRVMLMLPNCVEYVLSYYAILRLGAIVVQVNPGYQREELSHMYSISEPCLWIGESVHKEKVEPLKLQCLFVDEELSTRTNEDLERVSLPEVAVNASEDVAVIQFTGGTTGIPKGAMLTHRNLMANVVQTFAFAHGTYERGEEVFLGVSPFYHVLGMSSVMNQGLYAGATIVTMRKWNVEQGLRLIETYEPTYFPAVPTIYISILDYAKEHPVHLKSFKVMTSGSAPMPLEIIRQMEKLSDGGVISEGYGLSESSPTTHRNPFSGLRKIGSIGIPLPDTECRIVHVDHGEDLGVNEAGELLIKGPQVMKGYFRDLESTAMQLQEGWLATGDIATVDEDGYYYIVGRKKEMVIGSGYNIYPNEVEDVLYTHEYILEVSVYGVPDRYRGETLAASVVLKKGTTLTVDELRAWCKERLAAYKVPKMIEFRQELPKTNVGKVLRRKLAEEHIERLKANGN